MPPFIAKSEAETRAEIDQKLVAAGWLVQDKAQLNLSAAVGVVVRELHTDSGPADYMLFIHGKACGIIEAKPEGSSLGAVAEQSRRYATAAIHHIQYWLDDQSLPFLYEATNHEIRYRDTRDPQPRSRPLFHFHRPQTLKAWLAQPTTLRTRLQHLPALDTRGLRACQIDAIRGLEKSLKQNKPRALLQMATGAGKTYTACTQVYRLAKFAQVKRVLFLVDRGNLGRQALKEFQQYRTPDDGRKFTELYNAHLLGPSGIGDEIKVTISTIQRLYSQLSGGELDDSSEEISAYETNPALSHPREVHYNPHLPIETFDVVIIDECHRSIYNLWRQVLDYFDAFLIGLTATPTKATIGYFNQNLVAEYPHEAAVLDRVNVGYDIYRIKTDKSVHGGLIEAGTHIEIRDRLTKQKRWQALDQDEVYQSRQLDRSVIAPNQIHSVIRAFRERCLPECFPHRLRQGGTLEWIPKTLVFAKHDDHADRIVDTIREVFNQGNDFCKKITHSIGKTNAEKWIAEFRTSPQLRIVVSVDMIATGTDIKPLECLVFMRDVRSQAYYEQMKGRGTRVISRDALRKVTPDAVAKTRFVLVDAVGVTETDKTETRSLEYKPSVSTEKLMHSIALGERSPQTLQTLGNRLIRLDIRLDADQRQRVNTLLQQITPPSPGEAAPSLHTVASKLVRAGNIDYLAAAVTAKYGTHEVSDKQREAVYQPLATEAIRPFHNPQLRTLLETLRRDTDQLIDDSADELIDSGYDAEKAKGLIKTYQQFIADHKDELDAIQLSYSRPWRQRHLSHAQIQDLADAIQQPPYNIAPLEVWKAYAQLETSKVKGVPSQELLTNIVSLIRFSTGLANQLEPFPELVEQRFATWLAQQQTDFTPTQQQWLHYIKAQIAHNAEFELADFDTIPACNANGGLLKAQELFGTHLQTIVQELNGYLIA